MANAGFLAVDLFTLGIGGAAIKGATKLGIAGVKAGLKAGLREGLEGAVKQGVKRSAGYIDDVAESGVKNLGKNADEVAQGVLGQSDEALDAAGKCAEDLCFTPDTLVATTEGLVRLGEVLPGASVLAFDHRTGNWEPARVEARNTNRYSGLMVTLTVGGEQLTATAAHPIWVVSGRELESRAVVRSLASGQDEGASIEGRWVNSHDLQPGDMLQLASGETVPIRRVELWSAEDQEVCNLSVRTHHTFAASALGVLVHNEGWCEILSRVVAKPQSLVDIAVQLADKVHAHHIVQKTFNPLLAMFPGSKNWYIRESHKLLDHFGIPKLITKTDLRAAIAEGRSLANMTWALMGNGTHSFETVEFVYNALKAAGSTDEAIAALKKIAETFGKGDRLF